MTPTDTASTLLLRIGGFAVIKGYELKFVIRRLKIAYATSESVLEYIDELAARIDNRTATLKDLVVLEALYKDGKGIGVTNAAVYVASLKRIAAEEAFKKL